MKRLAIILILIASMLFASVQKASAGMVKFYLVPVVVYNNVRGPEYFTRWPAGPDKHPGLDTSWSMMDYGFAPFALLVAKDISVEDDASLKTHADVFAFPDNLDTPVISNTVDVFFESIHLPTDWLTPSTTYRELMRQTAGMFQFNQRYGGISAEMSGTPHSLFENATLDTRLRNLTTDEQTWFMATVASFGYNPDLISTNSRLRQLVKQAGDYWIGQIFYIGGIEF